jgi:anti-sigma B factor antagonist
VPAPAPLIDLLSVTALPGDRAGRVVVVVTGEVDASTAPLLQSCLRTQSGRRSVRELVVDLEQVTVLAAAGVTALAEARSRCRMRGARFEVRGTGRRSVHRRLQFADSADVPVREPAVAGWASGAVPQPRAGSR